jgi:sulfur-carrier protein
MATVCFHYWAGARAAAGVEWESVEAETVNEALALVGERRNDPRFQRILSVSSILVDSRVVRGDDLSRPLTTPVEVEVLPPYAGG